MFDVNPTVSELESQNGPIQCPILLLFHKEQSIYFIGQSP